MYNRDLPASIRAAPADAIKTNGVGDIAWPQSGRGLPTGSRDTSSALVEGSAGVAPPTTNRKASEIGYFGYLETFISYPQSLEMDLMLLLKRWWSLVKL